MLRRFLRNNPTTRRIILWYNIIVFAATRRQITNNELDGIYIQFTDFNPTHHEN